MLLDPSKRDEIAFYFYFFGICESYLVLFELADILNVYGLPYYVENWMLQT